MTDSATESLLRPTRRLTLLYVIALSMIALLTLVGQIVVQQAIVRLEGDSRIVNVAGRQRMLSQRLTRMALQLAFNTDLNMVAVTPDQPNDSMKEIRSELQEWNEHHLGLQEGSEQPPLPGNNSAKVQKLFENLDPSFAALKNGLEQWFDRVEQSKSAKLTRAERRELCFHSDQFLLGMDSIVETLEHEATDRVAKLRWIERGLLLATITVLLLEGIFIFSPAVASLQRTLQRLQKVTNELSDAKQIAESANIAKTGFLTRVSHELRTPLHAVQGMLSLVERESLPHRQRRRIRIAKQAAVSLGGLVDDLLDISCIEQHRDIALRKSIVDVQELVLSVIEIMRPHATEKGIELQLKLNSMIPESIYADSDRLRQILSNLIQNGIRFTSQGHVKCEIAFESQASQRLRIEVMDTGIGIDRRDQDRVYQSFVRGQQSHTQAVFGQGLGLGLSIVHGLVHQMEGTIELESDLGKGTRFTILLPVEVRVLNQDDEQSLQPASLQPAAPQAKSVLRTALIVDDSIANLVLMRSYMKLLGYRTMSVQTLSDAMSRIQRYVFDVILMDKHLPDGNGASISEFVSKRAQSKSSHGKPRLFLVTADFAPADNQGAISGFDGVLTKPLSLEQLRSALQWATETPYQVQLDVTESHSESAEAFLAIRKRLEKMVMEGLPNDVTSMQQMAQSGDIDQVQFVAHRIRGAAGNAGLSHIESISKDLEDASIEENLLLIQQSLVRLADACRSF